MATFGEYEALDKMIFSVEMGDKEKRVTEGRSRGCGCVNETEM